MNFQFATTTEPDSDLSHRGLAALGRIANVQI